MESFQADNGSKWVFRIKYRAYGTIERFKARLVAKGFNQKEGVDYTETFAPVAKMVTVRTLLTLGIQKGWHIEQLDINNAFLHGDLYEEVYMAVPQGYPKPTSPNTVCKLQKSLYGLKHANRQWFDKLTTYLKGLGFKQSYVDTSLFTLHTASTTTSLLVYVDDIIITGNDKQLIDHIKHQLDLTFSIKDLGPIHYYLGIECLRNTTGMVMTQRKYALELLKEAKTLHVKPAATPLDRNVKFNKTDGELLTDPSSYRTPVGKLLYLTMTRPDLAYAAQSLNQFLHEPRTPQLKALMRVIRYIKLCPGQGLLFPTLNSPILATYCDSDWPVVPTQEDQCLAPVFALEVV